MVDTFEDDPVKETSSCSLGALACCLRSSSRSQKNRISPTGETFGGQQKLNTTGNIGTQQHNKRGPSFIAPTSKEEHSTDSSYEKIAIVGMGMRYPLFINDPTKFLNVLQSGADSVSEIPQDRWHIDKFYHPDPAAKGMAFVKRGSFLQDNIYEFDANFFGISPNEAETMDPQQRLLLEVTFEAFQDAGIPITSMKGKNVGTFIAGFLLDHQHERFGHHGIKHADKHAPTYGSATLLSNRISYIFDFAGPAVTVDTACSGGMSALHLACSSLQQGEIEMAIAGGSNIMLNPDPYVAMCKGGFMAKDGHCKTFFESGDGYGRGEGVSVLLLKRLSTALCDEDDIYAVIDATSMNQDGRTQGIALPNQDAQIQNMKNALEKANLDPLAIDYVEAHGTGTKAGDPLEVNAIGAVYGKNGQREQPLPVGSVKCNLNHTEGNAGIAGIIKAALTVKIGKIIPHRNIGSELNAKINFNGMNVKIPLHGEKWYADRTPKTAAVNSFGYGGTNVHAILSRHISEDRLALAPRRQSVEILTFPFSANSNTSLVNNLRNMLVWLEKIKVTGSVEASDLAYHLNHQLDQLSHLVLYRAANLEDLVIQLKRSLSDEKIPASKEVVRGEDNKSKLVWVFTGMGPQWFGMGQELFQKEHVFRDKLNECDKLYKEISGGVSILNEMMKSESESHIPAHQNLTQASNFCLQIALSSLLISWGIKLDAIVGHSVGEVAASVVSGALDLPQGIELIYHRGNSLENIVGKGGMVATGLNLTEAEVLCARFTGVDIAAVNSETATVLSGSKDNINIIVEELQKKGVFAKIMRVDAAYHSSQVEDIKDEFLTRVRFLKPSNPEIKLYSTVTSEEVTNPIQDAQYWFANCRQKVSLYQTLQNIISRDGYTKFIEIGPHPVLANSIREISSGDKEVNVYYTLKRKECEASSILGNVASLLQQELVHTNLLFEGETCPTKRIKIPITYAWDKCLSWRPLDDVNVLARRKDISPLLNYEVLNSPMPSWHTQLRSLPLKFLEDHRVGENIVFPGAGYCEVALEVAGASGKKLPIALSNISFKEPLVFFEDPNQRFHTQLLDDEISIVSTHLSSQTVHATCLISECSYDYPSVTENVLQCFEKLDEKGVKEKYFQIGAKLGLNYGSCFQGIKKYYLEGETVFTSLKADHRHTREGDFVIHPAILDSAFQSLIFLPNDFNSAILPIGIGKLTVTKAITEHAFCTVKIASMERNRIFANLTLYDDNMVECCRVESLVCQITEFGNNQERFNKNLLYKLTPKPIELEVDQAHIDGVTSVFYKFNDFHLKTSVDTVSNDDIKEVLDLAEIAFHLRSQVILDLRQIVLDFRQPYSAEIGPYEACKFCALGLFQFVKMLCQVPHIAELERLVVIIQDGILDAENYPIPSVNPAMTAIAGMVRAIVSEVPFKVNLIDLDFHQESSKRLETLLYSSYVCDELIIRKGETLLISLERTGLEFKRFEEFRFSESFCQPKYYVQAKSGEEKSYFKQFTPVLSDNEVLIQVNAVSVEHNPVSRKTLSGHAFQIIGVQGKIVKVGKCVTGVSCGNTVFTLSLNNRLQSHVIANQAACAKSSLWNNPGISNIRTVAVAWIILKTLAKVSRGESILIHLEDNNLVHCFCQVARHHGVKANILTTSVEQKLVMKSKGLGSLLMEENDSTLLNDSFDAIIVEKAPSLKQLQSLINTLCAYGKIITFQKNDATSSFDLNRKMATIQFIHFDMSYIISHIPLALKTAIEGALSMRFSPSSEYILLSPEHIVDEHRDFGKDNHVVVDFLADAEVPTSFETRQDLHFEKHDAVLITGGCTGFGLTSALEVAEWGVKNIVLASRRGEAQDISILEQLKTHGVNVIEYPLDVTKKENISRLLNFLSLSRLKLCGIIHAATVFADKFLSQSSTDDFLKGFETKAVGAWNLHEKTLGIPLKFFVCYSSVSSCFGNSGQAAYAASNAFLDGLMAFRRAQSLVGLSISWGQIGEVGYVNENKEVLDFLYTLGVLPINPREGLKLMKEILLRQHYHILIHNADWTKNAMVEGTTTFESLRRQSKESKQKQSLPGILKELLQMAKAERLETIEATVINAIQVVTGHTDLTGASIISNLGIDSMSVGQVQTNINDAFSTRILDSMTILGASSIAQISSVLEKRVMEKKVNTSNES